MVVAHPNLCPRLVAARKYHKAGVLHLSYSTYRQSLAGTQIWVVVAYYMTIPTYSQTLMIPR